MDKAFSRASRAGGAKDGNEAQQSMLMTASNIASDNMENVVTAWPTIDDLDPFYVELADAVVGEAYPADDDPGIDALKQHLSEISWAADKVVEIRQEYESRVARGDIDTARKLRKQAFARIADVVEEVEDDLAAISTAHNALKGVPDIRPDEPAIVVAGYPNVGKSSFVNRVTRASNEIARSLHDDAIRIGHFEDQRIRYQIVDTPGLLDRPPEDRNEIESQAVSALEHLADAVLVFIDPSGECGYPLADQLDCETPSRRVSTCPC